MNHTQYMIVLPERAYQEIKYLADKYQLKEREVVYRFLTLGFLSDKAPIYTAIDGEVAVVEVLNQEEGKQHEGFYTYVLVQHVEHDGVNASDVIGVFATEEQAELVEQRCIDTYKRDADGVNVTYEIERHYVNGLLGDIQRDST